MKTRERSEEKNKKTGKVIKAILIVLAAVFVIVGGYLIYAFSSYYRLPDNMTLEIVELPEASSNKAVPVGEELTAISYNIGFGAYTPDFSFFMDGGVSSWGASKESTIADVAKAAGYVQSYEPDFVLFQEVDLDSTRSYHVDQEAILDEFFPKYNRVGALDYDSPFLFWPLLQPHGSSVSELATYSVYPMTSALRRSLPVSETVTKIVDLDRCYSRITIPTENGKDLCLYTIHMSAYGMDDSVRQGQIAMISEDMNADVNAGNYVICGGDFNHDLLAADDADVSVGWAMPFPRENLPEKMKFVLDLWPREEVETMHHSCRDADAPYEEGVSYTITVDNFIVSDNVEITSYDIPNTGYAYSDHEPIVIRFTLQH